MANPNPNMEVAKTQEIIKNCFPNFMVKRQQLLKPTPDFVLGFYSHYLSEAYQILSLFTNYEVVEKQSDIFSKEASRFRNICNFFNVVTLELTFFDLFNPKPRRTHTLIKYALNYIIYLFNNVDEMLEVHKAAASKAELKNILYQKTQHTLEELSEYTEAMACEKGKEELLKKKLEELRLKRKEMDHDKSAKQLRRERLLKQKEALQRQLELLGVNLKVGEDLKQKAEQKVVPEIEYEALKAIKESLIQEAQSVSFDNQQDLNEKVDKTKTMIKASNALKNVSFHSLPAKEIQYELEIEQKLQNNIFILNKEYTSLKVEQEKMLEHVKNDEQSLIDYKNEYEEVCKVLGLLDTVLTNLKTKESEINDLKTTLAENIRYQREQHKNLIDQFL